MTCISVRDCSKWSHQKKVHPVHSISRFPYCISHVIASFEMDCSTNFMVVVIIKSASVVLRPIFNTNFANMNKLDLRIIIFIQKSRATVNLWAMPMCRVMKSMFKWFRKKYKNKGNKQLLCRATPDIVCMCGVAREGQKSIYAIKNTVHTERAVAGYGRLSIGANKQVLWQVDGRRGNGWRQSMTSSVWSVISDQSNGSVCRDEIR